MAENAQDARAELEQIRNLMERARYYRHLPPQAPILAGLLAVGGGWWTHTHMGKGALHLAIVWGGIFLASLAIQLILSARAAAEEGSSVWSPLAAEIIHALWPPFLGACAFSVILVRADLTDLVPPLWMLCYGIGAIAAGAYARPAVRVMGVGFLIAGLATLVYPTPPGVALGVTFGGFHLVYGAVIFRRPAMG